MQQFFVGGIGTEVGKTFVSAILVEALTADYWKPVQCGNLNSSDLEEVQQLISNTKSIFHPEAYRLNEPLSPHAAAEQDNITIETEKITLPATQNPLIVEGVGGMMVPLNNTRLVIDLVKAWGLPTILVCKNYLGSINHTLLTIEALQKRNMEIIGIVFNGQPNPKTEEVILKHSGLKCLFRVNQENEINKAVVRRYASELKNIFTNELY